MGAEQSNDFCFHVETGGCLDEEACEVPVIRGENAVAVLPVPIEDPTSQEKGGPLVSFTERLGPANPKCQHSSGIDGIIDLIDGGKSTGQPVEFIGFVEPLVSVANGAIDGDGQVDRRPDQCSWRYSRSSWYSAIRSESQARSTGVRRSRASISLSGFGTT